MADRIAVLVDGEVVQFGTPEELWQRPNHPFVAATIADLQPLKGRIEGTQCVTAFGALPLRLLALTADLAEGTSVPIGVRPSSLTVSLEGPCVVNDIRFLGDRYTLLISADNQSLSCYRAQAESHLGDKVSISFAAAQAVILQP